MFPGADQFTVRLECEAAVTVGASGFAGGSASSVTVMVSVRGSVDSARAPVPPVAVTFTIYTLLAAAFTGSVLCTSVGFSKSGAVRKANAPAVEMLNFALSAPLSA